MDKDLLDTHSMLEEVMNHTDRYLNESEMVRKVYNPFNFILDVFKHNIVTKNETYDKDNKQWLNILLRILAFNNNDTLEVTNRYSYYKKTVNSLIYVEDRYYDTPSTIIECKGLIGYKELIPYRFNGMGIECNNYYNKYECKLEQQYINKDLDTIAISKRSKSLYNTKYVSKLDNIIKEIRNKYYILDKGNYSSVLKRHDSHKPILTLYKYNKLVSILYSILYIQPNLLSYINIIEKRINKDTKEVELQFLFDKHRNILFDPFFHNDNDRVYGVWWNDGYYYNEESPIYYTEYLSNLVLLYYVLRVCNLAKRYVKRYKNSKLDKTVVKSKMLEYIQYVEENGLFYDSNTIGYIFSKIRWYELKELIEKDLHSFFNLIGLFDYCDKDKFMLSIVFDGIYKVYGLNAVIKF